MIKSHVLYRLSYGLTGVRGRLHRAQGQGTWGHEIVCR